MSLIEGSRRHHKLNRLIDRDGVLCRWCQQPFGFGQPITFDHVIPLMYGGNSADDNLVLACARCNSDRHHYARCAGCGNRVRHSGVAHNRDAWHEQCLHRAG